MKQFCFGILPFFIYLVAIAAFLFLSVEASILGYYIEPRRRIESLTEALQYLEDEGQITIHVKDSSLGETDHYESPAEALAWSSHHKLNESISENQLPTIYLIAAGLSALAAIYIFAFGPRTPKPPTK